MMDPLKPINEPSPPPAAGGENKSTLLYILTGICAVMFLLSCLFFGLYVSASRTRVEQEAATQRAREDQTRLNDLTASANREHIRLQELIKSEQKEHTDWQAKNMFLETQIKSQIAYGQQLNASVASAGILTDILLYTALGSVGLNIPGVLANILLNNAMTIMNVEVQNSAYQNSLLKTKLASIENTISNTRLAGHESALQILGLAVQGCRLDEATPLYLASRDGWIRDVLRDKVKGKAGTLVVITNGDDIFGGIVTVAWPERKSPEDPFLKDVGARTFSSKSVGLCVIENTEHAIKLATDGSLIEFGEGEILVKTDGSGKAAGGHDYKCPSGINPHEFYVEGINFKKVNDVAIYEIKLEKPETQCLPS